MNWGAPCPTRVSAPTGGDLAELRATLDEVLDAHIHLLRDVVAIAQREQAHLIAFEMEELQGVVPGKRALVSHAERAEADTREAANALRLAAGIAVEDAPNLRRLIGHFPDAESSVSRVQTLRSLAQSLDELQAISAVHAQRGMRMLGAYQSLLVRESAPAGLYGPRGNTRRTRGPAGLVSREF